MQSISRVFRCALCVLWLGASLLFVARQPGRAGIPPKVTTLRVPEGGIQPQLAVDDKGVLHMVYLVGDPSHGDLYYVRSTDHGAAFSRPIKVNGESGSAVAVGNIRGAHIAAGKNGRVHVAWNGSRQTDPKAPYGTNPMLYTRLNDAGTAFEPERNLIHSAYGLDGGGSVAADRSGHVYVFWHAPLPGKKGEENRRVWVARSIDDGKSFDREKVAYDQPAGACGCCGLKAYADPQGNIYVLFRSATQMVHRDMYLLVSKDRGESFAGADISPWNVGYCVMSSESFASGPQGVLAAWETEKQVYLGRIDPATSKMSGLVPAPGATANRKHPAVAANSKGEVLMAWTEGMGWKKGGTLAWQVFDSNGRPEGEEVRTPGVPVWSLVAPFARPDGGFTVVY